MSDSVKDVQERIAESLERMVPALEDIQRSLWVLSNSLQTSYLPRTKRFSALKGEEGKKGGKGEEVVLSAATLLSQIADILHQWSMHGIMLKQ